MNHLDEHDSRALRLNRAMYAPLREVPIVITMDDEAADKRKADDAETLLTYLFWVNVVGGIGAVALVVYLVPWPQAITWLSGHFH